MVTEPRPQGVTLAATYLIVMGTLLTLVGGACTLFQGALTSGTTAAPNNLAATFRDATFVVGATVLVLGVLSIGAGSGSLAGRSWARWTGAFIGIVLAIVLCLVGVLTLTTQNGATAAIASIAVGVLYGLSAWALISAGAWFSARSDPRH